MKIDFAELREKVSITQVADWLGITVQGNGATLRGECPLCKDRRSFTITPSKGLWGCFACGRKGSILDLVMHVRELANVRDAAEAIHAHFLGTVQSTARRDSTVQARTEGELKPLDYLDAEHPAVDAVGFDTSFASTHGIGYAAKGIAKGNVLIPFRDETGKLLGYIGVTEEAWLPKEFKPNVVPLKQRA